MLYGQIKPIVIKVMRHRLRYRIQKTPINKAVRVMAYDMKRLLIADDKAKVHRVLWKDAELVTSETIVQVPIVQMGNQKIINRHRERNSLFKSSGIKQKPK